MEAVFSEHHRACLLHGELSSLGIHCDTAYNCPLISGKLGKMGPHAVAFGHTASLAASV